MADLRISELSPLTGADVQPSIDQLAVADISGSETKKTSPTGIAQAALGKSVADGGLANATILADKIKWASLSAEAIDGKGITINTLPGDRLVDKSVQSGKVGELKSVNLEDGAVITSKILDSAISTDKLANASVTSLKLATDAAVSNISLNSLDGSKVIDGTIGTVQVTDGSITAGKLGAGAAAGNLDDGSITTNLLLDSAVSTDKLANASVTSLKLASGAAVANIAVNQPGRQQGYDRFAGHNPAH